jgi:hypothetical protein
VPLAVRALRQSLRFSHFISQHPASMPADRFALCGYGNVRHSAMAKVRVVHDIEGLAANLRYLLQSLAGGDQMIRQHQNKKRFDVRSAESPVSQGPQSETTGVLPESRIAVVRGPSRHRSRHRPWSLVPVAGLRGALRHCHRTEAPGHYRGH